MVGTNKLRSRGYDHHSQRKPSSRASICAGRLQDCDLRPRTLRQFIRMATFCALHRPAGCTHSWKRVSTHRQPEDGERQSKTDCSVGFASGPAQRPWLYFDFESRVPFKLHNHRNRSPKPDLPSACKHASCDYLSNQYRPHRPRAFPRSLWTQIQNQYSWRGLLHLPPLCIVQYDQSGPLITGDHLGQLPPNTDTGPERSNWSIVAA